MVEYGDNFRFDNSIKNCYSIGCGKPLQRESVKMTEEEYNKIFNTLVRNISELLEVSGNYDLVRIIKKKLFDFSDKIKGESGYDYTKTKE